MRPSNKSYRRILDEHLHILIAQGNHEAYLKLLRRYKDYAENLAHELLDQYPGSGVLVTEITAVCSNRFSYIVRKYDPQLCSFYTFWRESSEQAIIDYFIDNSYLASAKAFRGFIHYDEEVDERRLNYERIAENDEDKYVDKVVRELKRVLNRHKDKFKKQEFAVMYLTLEGYSIKELEHTGMMSRSSLYLTFTAACDKLKTILEAFKK